MTWYLLALLPFLVAALVAFYLERRAWNNGICRDTGEPWIYFDRDSQGGRGYRSGKYHTWISWPGVDSRKS